MPRRRSAGTVTNDESKFKQWLSDVAEVLERPTIALFLFVIGVLFIVIASKQVKYGFDFLESFGVYERPPDGLLNNFMAGFVFLFVWMDIILVTKLVKWSYVLGSRACSYVRRVKARTEEVDNKRKEDVRNQKRRH